MAIKPEVRKQNNRTNVLPILLYVMLQRVTRQAIRRSSVSIWRSRFCGWRLIPQEIAGGEFEIDSLKK